MSNSSLTITICDYSESRDRRYNAFTPAKYERDGNDLDLYLTNRTYHSRKNYRTLLNSTLVYVEQASYPLYKIQWRTSFLHVRWRKIQMLSWGGNLSRCSLGCTLRPHWSICLVRSKYKFDVSTACFIVFCASVRRRQSYQLGDAAGRSRNSHNSFLTFIHNVVASVNVTLVIIKELYIY